MLIRLRFTGKMPRGKFEYSCGICGNYVVTNILEELSGFITFECKKCGSLMILREQETHWHITFQDKPIKIMD